MTIDELVANAHRAGWTVDNQYEVTLTDPAWNVKYNPHTKRLMWWRTEDGYMAAEPDQVWQKLQELRGAM